MTKKYRSRAMASIHETAEGLRAAGVMSERDSLRVLDLLENPPDPPARLIRAAEASFPTVDLSDDKVRAVAGARMDPRHDHLNAMLKEE